MSVAPNDVGVPDPGQDIYAGSVKKEMRDQARRRVWEEHWDDDGWRHDPDHQLDLDAAAKDALQQAREFAAEQHGRLAHGIAMRGGPQVGGTNYLSIPHDKLHEMVNTDNVPGEVNQAGAEWHEVGMALRRIGDRLARASSETEQGWSGSAAEGARAFNSGVAGWSDTTAQGALLSSNNMATQSDAAGTVKSTVPPPMEYSLWDQVTDLLSAPDPASGVDTIRTKLAQQQELHRQAADAVAAYDQTLAGSSATMPAFETPPAFDPSYRDPTPPPGGGVEPSPGHRTEFVPVGGRPPESIGSPPPGGPDSAPPPDQREAPDDPRTRQPGSTGTDPARADLGSPGQSRLGGTGVGVDGPGGPGSGGRGAGEPGAGALGAVPVGGPGGAGGGGGARGGYGGPGGARGGIEGRIPGPGAGALAAEHAAAGRGAAGAGGARGAAGLGGMPVGTGGSGRGGEDTERERPSYLLEDDPDALFGTDEPASPPVIE